MLRSQAEFEKIHCTLVSGTFFNFCSILFTFADAQHPPAMEVVKKADIPHDDQAMFKFNNSAIYASR